MNAPSRVHFPPPLFVSHGRHVPPKEPPRLTFVFCVPVPPSWDTYFYEGPGEAVRTLTAGNTESVGRLLLRFLWHFAFEHDPGTDVVSVRPVFEEERRPTVPGIVPRERLSDPTPDTHMVSREYKIATASWHFSNGLSIEDPFETTYDVAHVLRPVTYSALKHEFLVRCIAR